MTGLHSGHCTIRGNDGSYTPLLPNDTTVAKVLNDRYNTACKRLLTPVKPDLGIVPRPWPSALSMSFLLCFSHVSPDCRSFHLMLAPVFGKWGLGDFGTSGYPLNQGFDTFIGQDSQVACHNW